MGQANENLAALIGSRICHDLISPIGAIHNGLELLDMAGAASGPEMGLIADSVTNAEARIRFFRLAYGAAGDQAIPRSEVVSVLRDVASGGRLNFEWMPLEPQPRCEVRLALLCIQCLETAMPYGGDIRITQDGAVWTVAGSAERLSLDPVLWGGLTDLTAKPEITPALVQFGLLPAAVEDAGRNLQVAAGTDRIELTF
ncbi:histidine phosphotransferase family protein [Marinibacterium profundimaris]|uniref:Histidine phosphotransferase n=1 Tax=Marinibacterium profundimaris TaxID=1679460 RepID=A0A225NSI9_9RHOB|nr:histidine phosphotransferase family protein [Marinibacterium profundimaris]OWU77290.1 histidine phosphotransferase [Marinibacterium profundimaris]